MLNVIVLAAGKGTRMKSRLPKVLHPIAGRPMLQHVLDSVRKLSLQRPINTIIGHGAEQIEAAMTAEDLRFILQSEQLGTGHAVQQALPYLEAQDTVLILYGDVPLIKADTLAALVDCVSERSLGLLTLNMQDPTGYGRIVRDDAGRVLAIVEQKDATDEQLAISEVNTGIMAVRGEQLQRWLPQLSAENAQGEYYLTDIIAMAGEDGVAVETKQPAEEWEVMGINNRQQQAELERIYQLELARQFLRDGISLADPARFDCRGSLSFGEDVRIDINCVIEGDVQLGDNVQIGPNCCIKNARIGDNSVIKANSIIEDATLAAGCEVGPFARLRPGADLKAKAKVGNFVEVKKAVIGEGSKVNHLSYIGDAKLGTNVNVGAGTITCNYDGVNKSKTEIGDEAFIGSNTALVAPVKVGRGATIGAGSTISADVPDQQLAVGRARQRNIQGWERPTKKS